MTSSSSLSARMPAADLAVLRRRLLDRGQVLATKLSQLLAAADPFSVVAALGLDLKPGARPEEVLRAAMAKVDGMIKQIAADDDRYGRCHQCGVDLGVAALLEVPWADACPAHA